MATEPDFSSLQQYKDSLHYRKIHDQAESLGLLDHLDHLDEYGYTIVPPELVAPAEFRERLLDAVLAVNEERSGDKIKASDVSTTQFDPELPGRAHWAILAEDPVFQELVMNPTVLTMAKYLCGNSVLLSDLNCILKQKHERLTHPLQIGRAHV